MENEESGRDPDSDVEPEMKVLTPPFAELFRKVHHDMGIIFPAGEEFSPEERMIATVGALLAMKMEECVKVLKTPMKVMKMGPGGIIQPGG